MLDVLRYSKVGTYSMLSKRFLVYMQPENQNIEYKERLNDKLEREVVGFLNSKLGGELYIGVADDGTIVGIDNADALQLAVADRLKNNILPSCLGLFDMLVEEHDDKQILHIHISAGQEKPYYIRQYGMSPNGCYLRVGAGLKQMDEAMISGLFSSRTRTSLRNIVSPRYGAHNFQQLKIYYQEHGLEINDEFLQNLDLYTPDGKLNMVAYMLADVNSLSVRFAKYAGTDKCDLLETQEFGYCSLLKAMDKLWDKIDVENRTMARVTGQLRREEKRLVDYTALREAFINAFVHNDYTTEQAPIVEIFSDRMTITSYGGLVHELSQEEFFNGRSIPRNRELMRIFHDMDWVEQLGSGIHRILRKYPKEIYEISEHFVVVTFKFAEPLTDDQGVSQQGGTKGSTEGGMKSGTIGGTKTYPELSFSLEQIVNLIVANPSVSIAEIAARTKKAKSGVQKQVKRLQEMGIIRRVGPNKGGYWEIVK